MSAKPLELIRALAELYLPHRPIKVGIHNDLIAAGILTRLARMVWLERPIVGGER
jgi:hypothetical protein